MLEIKFIKRYRLINKNLYSKATFFKDLNIGDIFSLEYNMKHICSKSGMRGGYYQPGVLLKCGNIETKFTINQFLMRFKNVDVEEIN